MSVSVSMCSPPSGYTSVLFGCIRIFYASYPPTVAVTIVIVVYSLDILHLLPGVHQPLSVLVRSF